MTAAVGLFIFMNTPPSNCRPQEHLQLLALLRLIPSEPVLSTRRMPQQNSAHKLIHTRLGFFGSSSTPVIDTIDVGVIERECVCMCASGCRCRCRCRSVSVWVSPGYAFEGLGVVGCVRARLSFWRCSGSPVIDTIDTGVIYREKESVCASVWVWVSPGYVFEGLGVAPMWLHARAHKCVRRNKHCWSHLCISSELSRLSLLH
jgi:hypothetical protein